MSMADPSKWDWADAIAGMLMGLISGLAGLFSWFSSRVNIVHERIDVMHEKTSAQASSIAVLEAHHEANLKFQGRIDDSLSAINDKQDRQMEILMDLRGRGK